jgi:sugar phosphate isomerase/epimerase
MTWSFQLYSARNFQPWTDVFRTLAELGYRNVEGFGGIYTADLGPGAGSLKEELDRAGLAMPSGHFSLAQLEDSDASLELARSLGMKLVACPHIAADDRPADAEGWRAFARRLAEAGKPFVDAGFAFAWHNHDFEFKPLADGSVPMTHILEAAPQLGWEMDVAWVIRGGANPLPWIDRYGSRILAVHVKDIARPGEGLDEDGWSDVGHGTVDWAGLMARLKAATPARYYIMEQDNPNDVRRFAQRSLDTVRAL